MISSDNWNHARKILHNEDTKVEEFEQALQNCQANAIALAKDSTGDTLLQVAVKKNRLDAIKAILKVPGIEEGFRSRNIFGQTLLCYTVFRGLLEVLRLLIDRYGDRPELFDVDIKIRNGRGPNLREHPLTLFCLMLHSEDRFELFEQLLRLKPDLSNDHLQRDFFSFLLSSIAKWQIRYNDQARPRMSFFRRCLQQNLNSVQYTTPTGNGFIHDCVEYHQPRFLPVVIDALRSKYSSKNLPRFIEATNHIGFTPLLLCCRNNFQSYTNLCRVDCARILIQHGANVNYLHPDLSFTPLLFCLAYEDYNESKGELACLLLDNGADPSVLSTNEVCCAYYAILSHAVPVVKKLVEKGNIDFTKHLVNSRRFPIVLAADNYLVSRDANEANVPGLELLLYFKEQGSPTTCALFSICFCLNQNFERGLLKRLLEEGFEVGNDAPNHLPLLFLAVRFGDTASAIELLKYGADENKIFKPTLCLNEPVHRWVGFDTLRKYFLFHNTDPERRKCRCHLCLRTLVNTDPILACAEGDSCDCRICLECAFYVQKNSTNIITLKEFAKRTGTMRTFRSIDFLTKTIEGSKLLSAKTSNEMHFAYLNAGITDEDLLSRMTPELLNRMGIKVEN